jgi:hypothetical protein
MSAEQAVSFEIVDLVTGNTVAGFDDADQAHQALARLAAEQPGDRDRLALMFFDAQGEAIESRLSEEPISA